MIIKVKRISNQETYTIGKLYLNNVYECDVLEDKNRGLYSNMDINTINKVKVHGETCIPYGKYKIDMNTVSPKFKNRNWAKFCNGKLPRLVDVPGFSGVLIHCGNKATDTEGCLLLGHNTIKGQVTNSIDTFIKFYNKVDDAVNNGEEITISIE